MNIFIAGLNYNMSEAELGELFAEYGEVVSVWGTERNVY